MKKSQWVQDIDLMHKKYGTNTWVEEHKNSEKLVEYIKFRINLLNEEVKEANEALEKGDHEEYVDAMIDICVVAIGNLTTLGIEADKAWKEVHKANMNKRVGIKETRPNPLGLPDLVKPFGWVGPKHKGNYGLLPLNFVAHAYRHAIKVLNSCADIMKKKGEDYNNVPQADYYPGGLRDIWLMMHQKMTRIKSLLQTNGMQVPNNESLEDSAKDLINYSAFFVEFAEGKMNGQCKK